MNTVPQQQKSITIKLPSNNPKPVASLTYVLALLLFFLPFMKLKCNDQTIVSVSGKDLITGINIEEAAKNSLFGDLLPKNKKDESSDKVTDSNTKTKSDRDFEKMSEIEKPNKLAIGSLIAGLIACLISFLKFRRSGAFSAASGALAGVLLLFIFFSYQSSVKDLSSSSFGMSIGISFTIWFFICLLFFFAGCYFSYKVYLNDEAERHQFEMEEYMKMHNYNSADDLKESI